MPAVAEATAAAAAVSRQAGSVSDALRHYGRCYFELSKARLRCAQFAPSPMFVVVNLVQVEKKNTRTFPVDVCAFLANSSVLSSFCCLGKMELPPFFHLSSIRLLSTLIIELEYWDKCYVYLVLMVVF